MRLLRLALLVFGGQMMVLLFLALLLARDRASSTVLAHTMDFGFFYDGARAWLGGGNPYHVHGFITPPPSLLVVLPFTPLPFTAAALLFSLCNVVLVSVSLWWYAGMFRLSRTERALVLVASWLFLCTLQSVFGGNLDGCMLALLVAAFSLRRRLPRAFSLASSIVVKLYSVLFLAVAVRRRQWRFLALTLAAALLLLLPFHALWPSALHALARRSVRTRTASISPATLIAVLFGTGLRTTHMLCLAFWLMTFAVALYRDRMRTLSPSTLARYAPWMLGYPPLVFPYAGILATAVLPWLVATARSRPLHWAERSVFLGFLLLGIHVDQATNAMALSHPVYLYFRVHALVIQSCGVTLMMAGASLAPFQESWKAEAAHEA